ncbi:helix-turn-helix transcriptional regulator [Nonomuraea jiangxiensis]|nr:helix-turn-helix transcriptional regulator [Nonomuraea jiangxiensis]
MDRVNREELAAFLRSRRALVRPADVGLEAGKRRRTPGLRREEVAQLAGMSVDYYARLEQGRGPRPSRQMLGAIARALRLSDDERSHLHYLTGEPPGPPSGPPRDLRPSVLHLLDRLPDNPVIVLDAKFDVLAWNALAAALLTDFSTLPADERNIVWRFFTDPRAESFLDAEDTWHFARAAVADLRAVAARYPADPGVKRLIGRLLAGSAEFAELWAGHDVTVRRSVRKRLNHPVVGWLELDCDALHVPESDQWVVFYTAAPGSPSYEALRLLKVVGIQDLGVSS